MTTSDTHDLPEFDRLGFYLKKLKNSLSIDDVEILEQECFENSWNAESYYSFDKNDSFHCWMLYTVEGKAVGTVSFYMIPPEIEIIRIAILPAFRKSGLGELLLKTVGEYGLKYYCLSMVLEVHENNTPAINLYRKFGFIETGRRKKYYSTPPGDALLLVKQSL